MDCTSMPEMCHHEHHHQEMMHLGGLFQIIYLVFFSLAVCMFIWRLAYFRNRRWYPISCDVAHGLMVVGMIYMLLPTNWQTIPAIFPVVTYLVIGGIYLVCAPLIQMRILHECLSCARRSYLDGVMAIGMAYMFGMSSLNAPVLTYIFMGFFAYLAMEYSIRTVLFFRSPNGLVRSVIGRWDWNLQHGSTNDPLVRIGFHICGIGMSIGMIHMFNNGKFLQSLILLAVFLGVAVALRAIADALKSEVKSFEGPR